jgi:hypothetical protein
VYQSFLSVFPYISDETMATGQKCCHLPGEMLNLTAKAGDRAQIALMAKLLFPVIVVVSWHLNVDVVRVGQSDILTIQHTFSVVYDC